MIRKYGEDDFRLICDHCEDECDEFFETFYDAVEYKKDKSNRWRSIKIDDDEWWDLCPSCNRQVIIAKLWGEKPQRKPPNPDNMEGFKNFWEVLK
jgi:hypothetical protein